MTTISNKRSVVFRLTPERAAKVKALAEKFEITNGEMLERILDGAFENLEEWFVKSSADEALIKAAKCFQQNLQEALQKLQNMALFKTRRK